MAARLQVKEIAQKQGLNQRVLAERSGVTLQLLNRYWNNNVQRVDLDEMEKIAAALGVKIGDLLISDRTEDVASSKEEDAA